MICDSCEIEWQGGDRGRIDLRLAEIAMSIAIDDALIVNSPKMREVQGIVR